MLPELLKSIKTQNASSNVSSHISLTQDMVVSLFKLYCWLFACLPATLAYSFGAGGCAGGHPAVGVPHLLGDPINDNTNVTNGTLAQGDLFVPLDGVVLKPGVAASFTIGVDHNLTLSPPSSGYKGLLFRLGGVGTTALSPFAADTSGLLQVSIHCVQDEQVSGITHTSSDIKRQSSAKLRYDGSAAKSLPLDVTVVIENINQNSNFYYSGLVLNAVSNVVPTSTPMAASAKPVDAPTPKPLAPTTKPVNPTRYSKMPLAPTSKPVNLARNPKPLALTAKPVSPTRKPTPAPVRTTFRPVKPTPKPARPSAKPVKTSPKPAKPTPKLTSPASRPAASPLKHPPGKPLVRPTVPSMARVKLSSKPSRLPVKATKPAPTILFISTKKPA